MNVLRLAVVTIAFAPATALAQTPDPRITVAPPTGIKPQLQPVVVPGPTPVPKTVTAPPVTVRPPVETGKPTVFPKVGAVKPEQFPKSPAVFPKAPAVIPKAPAVRLTPLDNNLSGQMQQASPEELKRQEAMQLEGRKFQTMSNATRARKDAENSSIRNTK